MALPASGRAVPKGLRGGRFPSDDSPLRRKRQLSPASAGASQGAGGRNAMTNPPPGARSFAARGHDSSPCIGEAFGLPGTAAPTAGDDGTFLNFALRIAKTY